MYLFKISEILFNCYLIGKIGIKIENSQCSLYALRQTT